MHVFCFKLILSFVRKMFTVTFLPSLIILSLFPLSSLCSVIQNVADVQSKCNPYASPNEVLEIVKGASETFTSCLSSISEPSNKEEFYKFVCTDMAQTGYNCLNGLMGDGCIHSYSKIHYNHIMQVFNATINEQCKGGKERFTARAPAIEDMSYKPKLVELSVDIYKRCFPILEVLLEEHLRIYVSSIQNFQLCGSPGTEGLIFGTLGNRSLHVYGFDLIKRCRILCENIAPNPIPEERARSSYTISAFARYWERKCYLNANKETFQQLNWAYNNMDNLTELSFPKSVYLLTCFEPPGYLLNLLVELVHCLEPESKFLSEFVLGAFNTTMAQICSRGNKFIAQNEELVHCNRNTSATDISDMITNECWISKTTIFKNGFLIDSEIIITKPLFCSELKLVIDCIAQTLNTQCGSDEIAQYFLGFLLPFLDSCNSDIGVDLI